MNESAGSGASQDRAPTPLMFTSRPRRASAWRSGLAYVMSRAALADAGYSRFGDGPEFGESAFEVSTWVMAWAVGVFSLLSVDPWADVLAAGATVGVAPSLTLTWTYCSSGLPCGGAG